MSRSHFSRKLCLVMTASLVVITFFVVGYFGSSAISSPVVPAYGSGSSGDQSTLELLHVVIEFCEDLIINN
ncbi:hypothetical protein CVS40_10754 [Lucilia cuprina]|nr:hypothetical protein CVS40_10754 [Lucilia cuprina]